MPLSIHLLNGGTEGDIHPHREVYCPNIDFSPFFCVVYFTELMQEAAAHTTIFFCLRFFFIRLLHSFLIVMILSVSPCLVLIDKIYYSEMSTVDG